MEVFALKFENCTFGIFSSMTSPEFIGPIVTFREGRMVSHVFSDLLVSLFPCFWLLMNLQSYDARCVNFETRILLFLNLLLDVLFKTAQRADSCFRIKSELAHCHRNKVFMASSVQQLQLGEVFHLNLFIKSEVVLQN